MNGGGYIGKEGDSDPLALPILPVEQCYHIGSPVALAQSCFTDEWTGGLAQA